MNTQEYMKTLEFCWDQDPEDPMVFVVYNFGKPVLRMFIGEAMELAGRNNVMRHIAECEKSPWITTWHNGPASDTFRALKNSG